MDHLKEVPKEGRFGTKGNYDIRFIKEVVRLVEEGLSYGVLCSTYNLNRTAIYRWVVKYGSPDYVQSIQRTIPSQDKRTAVRAIASGRLTTKEASVAYGVSDTAIRKWWKKYAEENNELSFSNPEELSKKKAKKQTNSDSERLRYLEQQLSDAQLKIAALDTLIDVAEEQLKINIRKKPGARRS